MTEQTKEHINLSSPTGGQGAFLFVYGTLRKEYGLPLTQKLAMDLECIGSAKINGTLYDLGTYPGAVKSKAGEIAGDVYKVYDAEKTFGILDEYEGEEYSREQETVTLASGETIIAWVYWYKQKPRAAKQIDGPDYLHYLVTKKTD